MAKGGATVNRARKRAVEQQEAYQPETGAGPKKRRYRPNRQDARSASQIKKKSTEPKPRAFDWTYPESLCRRRSLKPWNNRHALNVGCSDAFEVRPDAAKFRIHKCVDEVQLAIEPREQAVFNVVMDRKCDLGAVRPDLGEINQTHHLNVSAR